MLHSMASLSVLNYNLPPGLTMKLNNANTNSSNMSNSTSSPGRGLMSKTFNKITVQNVLSENNSNALNIAQGNPNAIVRKIKDFGMIGTVNSAGAKSLNINCNPRKRPLSENTKSSPAIKEKKAAVSVAKKPKLSKEERTALRLAKKAAKENSSLAINALSNAVVAIKLPGTPGRKGLPLPQAVARRNARERNRVKQVNNGFAALRERIPEEVAEAFEAHSSCKNNGKKLSKVETLRMAVEYIRSLERLLGFDFPITSGKGFHSTSSSGEESFSLIKDEFDAFSPSMDEHFDDSLSHYDNEDYFAQQSSPVAAAAPTNSSLPQLEALPNITTLNGLQYIRIPGTNTYQLLTPDIFVGTAASPPSSTVDEEHFNALIDANCVSPTSMSSPIPAATAATSLSTSLAHATTADLNSSPPAIRASTMSISSSPVSRTVNAPVSTNTKCAKTMEGSESLLSTCSSPVPQQQQQQQHQHSQQMISPMLTSSPSTTSTCHNNNNNNNNDATTAPTLQATTPAVNKRHHHHHDHRQQQLEGLGQACAVNNQQQQQQQQLQRQQHILENYVIKQEFEEPTIIYHHQTSPVQQQHQLYMPPHNTMVMSPPLERQTPTTSNASSAHLQQFFNTNGSAVFFDGVVNLKKEFTEDLLDGPHTSNVLSDESMIESIDWWEAHTPKSDGGSVMM